MTQAITALDIALSLAVVLVVGLTLLQRSRKTQSLAYLGLGVILSLVWLRLGSVDVGLAEAGLGSGILSAVLVILAAAPTAEQAHQAQATSQRTLMPVWLSVVLGVVSGAILVFVVASIWLRAEQQVPQWEALLAPAMDALPVEHPITGVLLAFRGYDTLLESAVLMFAALTAKTLMPDDSFATVARTHQWFLRPARAMDFSWAFRMLTPILLLVGLWLLFAGTTQPGGAFQSGAVLAAMLIMVQLTGGRLDHLIRRWLTPLAVVGVVVFVLSSAVGLAAGATWFTMPAEGAYALILTVETCLTVGIAIGLYMLYLAVAYRVALPVSPPEDQEVTP